MYSLICSYSHICISVSISTNATLPHGFWRGYIIIKDEGFTTEVGNAMDRPCRDRMVCRVSKTSCLMNTTRGFTTYKKASKSACVPMNRQIWLCNAQIHRIQESYSNFRGLAVKTNTFLKEKVGGERSFWIVSNRFRSFSIHFVCHGKLGQLQPVLDGALVNYVNYWGCCNHQCPQCQT